MRWPWQSKVEERGEPLPLTLDQYIDYFKFQGLAYQLGGLNQTYQRDREEIGRDFIGLTRGAYKQNGVVFACMLVRMLLFAEARFQFRQVRGGRPGDLFGSTALAPLENPWPGGTTGDLLSRAIQDADLAGNFFAIRRAGGRIVRMRPDWMTIVLNGEPGDVDAEKIGYLYTPGGIGSGNDPIPYDVEEIAHFAPIPDPEAQYRGMSWLSPIVEEIVGDKAMSRHKVTFFERGGTPNLVVQFPVDKVEAFDKWVEKASQRHPGMEAQTLFLAAGADAKVIGSTFEQTELKETQGALETRIAAAAGVPPVIVGLSEGLDAATYSNYAQARRRFADGTMRPLWRNIAGSLARIIDVPAGSELWYDDRDISFLQEDMKDAAEIQGVRASTIRALIEIGFTPESSIAAVDADDFARLVHTGLYSVQLQPPGTTLPPNGNGDAPDDARALAERKLRELMEAK